jgi:hypothetical protein
MRFEILYKMVYLVSQLWICHLIQQGPLIRIKYKLFLKPFLSVPEIFAQPVYKDDQLIIW